LATQPQHLRNGLGAQVEFARKSLPKELRPSQDDFYDLCNARFYMQSKRDAFRDKLRGEVSTSAEDYAAMCTVMNELWEGAGLPATLPRINSPFPRTDGGEVVPLANKRGPQGRRTKVYMPPSGVEKLVA